MHYTHISLRLHCSQSKLYHRDLPVQAQRINRYLILDLVAFASVAAATQAFRPE